MAFWRLILSTANISYFAAVAVMPGNAVAQAVETPALSTEEVTFTGTSAQTAAFPTGARFMRVIVDANARMLISTTATGVTSTTGTRLKADTAEYFAIPAGGQLKAGFISSAT